LAQHDPLVLIRPWCVTDAAAGSPFRHAGDLSRAHRIDLSQHAGFTGGGISQLGCAALMPASSLLSRARSA
jgi:hypothetical protein